MPSPTAHHPPPITHIPITLPLPQRLTARSAWGEVGCCVQMHGVAVDAVCYEERYRDVERFLQCCRACHNYAHTWACPPFEPHCPTLFTPGDTLWLVGTRLTPDDATRQLSATTAQRDAILHALIHEAIGMVESLHRQWEADVPGSRAYLFSACQLCEPLPCTRSEGKPCRHPDKVRPSLEALGFNLAQTADELLDMPLLWSTDHSLPAYTLLLTAQRIPHNDAADRQQ